MKFIYDSEADKLTMEFKPSRGQKLASLDLGNHTQAFMSPKGKLCFLEIGMASAQYPVLKEFIQQADQLRNMQGEIKNLGSLS